MLRSLLSSQSLASASTSPGQLLQNRARSDDGSTDSTRFVAVRRPPDETPWDLVKVPKAYPDSPKTNAVCIDGELEPAFT